VGGVYTHILPLASDGLLIPVRTRIFPNRNVPDTQVSSRGIGWDATDSWLLEGQFCIPSGSTLQIACTADADVDIQSPDIFYLLTLFASGDLAFRWDNRNGQANAITVSDVIRVHRWHHIAMQKTTNDSNVRVYCDGVLVLTEDAPHPLTNFDEIKFAPTNGIPRIREFSVRTRDVYPITPFTPGPVSFAATLGDTQSRWNSYMIL